ncbi:hypothetical protein AAG570_001870 [Ranatra chinensis]|uniref:Junctophilin n=1 Tax=Ranatra chinensis TaxID=642074 RepID=A0ABD0Y9T4_9HEMI
MRGMRHGYGVRASAPFGLASHYRPQKALRASLTSLRSNEAGGGGLPPGTDAAVAERDRRVDDSRGGFVLKARSDELPPRRRSLVEKSSNIKNSILSGLKIKKQKSTGDLEKRGTSGGSIRSTGSSASWVSTESSQSGVTSGSLHTNSNASFVVEDEHMDASVTETYLGEWKNDKRSGFGISERSDGLRYEGEWFNNKKYGYGVTTFRDGSKEEGKYKNNVLITSQKKKHLFLIRSAKFRERIDAAVNAAQRASKIALQKADIAISRTATARGKAELADVAADHAREDFEIARATAKQFAPDFILPGLEKLRHRELPKYKPEDNLHPAKAAINQQKPIGPPGSSDSSMPPTPASATSTKYEPAGYTDQSDPQQYTTKAIVNTSQQQTNNPMYQQPYQQQQLYQQQPYQQQQSYQQQQPYQQHKQTANYPTHTVTPPTPVPDQHNVDSEQMTNRTNVHRNSKQLTGDTPSYNFQQAMSDHFDHYKRPPSRDSSVDRYTRAASRLAGSRQSSVDKVNPPEAAGTTGGTLGAPADRQGPGSRAPSVGRGGTPVTGNGAAVGAGAAPYTVPQSPPAFEEVILRKRGLGQDIVPSLIQPKRTESLYITPPRKEPQSKSVPINTTLQRKKSLPDVQGLPKATETMSREEVSVLSSARREELRRMQEEAEKLKANPLLYLVSPHVKEWFSRQQLVMLVLFLNISLAIMFFKLLT